MKSRIFTLTLISLSSVLTACGSVPSAQMQLPRMQTQRALSAQTQRTSAGQLVYAAEMRGFSSQQNPVRTMMLEYQTADGQVFNFHADRFLNYPEFQIQLSVRPKNSLKAQDKYFPSTDKAQVKALISTLQALNTQGATAEHLSALGRIIAHLQA